MMDQQGPDLRGRRLLIAEDEYMVAYDLAEFFEDAGAEVIGPVGSVKDALALIVEEGARLDGALLDVNLHNEKVFPVAEALSAAGVPFVFATGYDAYAIPEVYASVPQCSKPVDRHQLARLLAKAVLRPGQ
jgi:DNA-binding LytR/AlgR family response regulator